MKNFAVAALVVLAGGATGWSQDSEKTHAVQAHLRAMAEAGDGYEVVIQGSDAAATVGEIRQIGYELRIDENDEYVLVKKTGNVVYKGEACAEVLRRIHAAANALARSVPLNNADDNTIGIMSNGFYFAVSLGELRRAGYEVRVDYNHEYVFVRQGEEPLFGPSAGTEVMVRLTGMSLRGEDFWPKWEPVTGKIGAALANLNFE